MYKPWGSFEAVAKFICSTIAAVSKKLRMFSNIYGNNARVGILQKTSKKALKRHKNDRN